MLGLVSPADANRPNRREWLRAGAIGLGGLTLPQLLARRAAAPIDRPLRAKDVLATAHRLLGIDHERTVTDKLDRPVPLLPDGEVIREALA